MPPGIARSLFLVQIQTVWNLAGVFLACGLGAVRALQRTKDKAAFHNKYADFVPGGIVLSVMMTGDLVASVVNDVQGIVLVRRLPQVYHTAQSEAQFWGGVAWSLLTTAFLYGLTAWHIHRAKMMGRQHRRDVMLADAVPSDGSVWPPPPASPPEKASPS